MAWESQRAWKTRHGIALWAIWGNPYAWLRPRPVAGFAFLVCLATLSSRHMSWYEKTIEHYQGWPEWLRWILFLPISFVLSVFFGYAILLSANFAGIFTPTRADILHPVIVQTFFLLFVYITVPRSKLVWVAAFIGLRSLWLLLFIAQPVLNLIGTDIAYDSAFFKDALGEVLTLAVSVYVYQKLKKEGLSFVSAKSENAN